MTWILTDGELELTIVAVKEGKFLERGLVCPDIERAIAIAQARKLVTKMQELHFFAHPFLSESFQGLLKEIEEEGYGKRLS